VAWLLAPPLCAAALFAIVLMRVQSSFDPAAFRSPSFYARGAELGQLLDVADKAEEAAGRYSSSVHRTLAGYAALLGAGANISAVAADAPAVLISDLHVELLIGMRTGRWRAPI
jgi:hypothetical protein